jgi:hypothetical protein
MTDWLRLVFYTVLGVIVALGVLATGWIVWSKRKLNQYRFSPKQHEAIKASRVGWWGDQKENDQSRVDRRS